MTILERQNDMLGPWASWSDQKIIDWAMKNLTTNLPKIFIPLRTIREDDLDTARIDFTSRDGTTIERFKRTKVGESR